MPGRSPAEAIHTFVDPLKYALAAVARANICLSPGGYAPQLGTEYSWTLNDGEGATLRGGYVLYAAMKFRVIEDPTNGPFRVTTNAYGYSLEEDGDSEIFAVHWHPDGAYKRPHVHLGSWAAANGPIDYRHHLPTGRMTFEQSIRWALEFGVEPLGDDSDSRLALAEAPHLLNRSWNTDPTLRPSGNP